MERRSKNDSRRQAQEQKNDFSKIMFQCFTSSTGFVMVTTKTVLLVKRGHCFLRKPPFFFPSPLRLPFTMSFFSVHTSHLKQIKTISYGITDDHACGCIRPGTSCYLLTDRTTFKECRHSRLHRSFVVWALLQKSLGRCPKASCHIQHWDSSRMTLQPSVLSVPSLSKLRSSLPLWHI